MTNTFIALDIGSRSAHALWLTLHGSQPIVTRMESFALPMDEENPHKLIATWVDSIGISRHFCAVVLPGAQSLFQSGRIMPNDPRTPEQVASMDIAQFSEMAGDAMSHSVFAFEPKNEPKTRRYIMSMARPAAIQQAVQGAQLCHVRPADLISAPVALFNAAESMAGAHEKPWCYISIGHAETQIAVGVPDGLLFARSIPLGGKLFTEAVAQATSLPPVQAEVRKHADCGLGEADACHAELRAAADRWISQFNASLGVYKSQFQDRKFNIEKIFITGGGAQLKGLRAYLEAKLFLPVQMTTDLPSVPVSFKLAKENGTYDIAYGIALTASQACVAYLSLLPETLKDEVVFRQKKPWWIAAALFLLAGLGLYSATGLYILHRDTTLIEEEKAKLADRERIDHQIQATRMQCQQIMTNSVPLSDLLVNGPLARAVLTLVASSVDPNDWITLFCDEKIYNRVEQQSDQPVQNAAATVAKNTPFSLFRTLRPEPASAAPTPNPATAAEQQKKELVDALSTVFIVEGYTPNPSLKSVREMIGRLKTAPEIARVDLRSDDQVLQPTGIPELQDEKLPNFRRFVIEIEVKRP